MDTIILKDVTGRAQVEVVPERGGIITQWQVNHQSILYLDRERFADPNLTVRGGIPILFPICGNLPDNTYTYQGQSYTLKQHGFARNLPWQVEDQAGDSLTLSLSSSEQTLVQYPFPFRLVFTYHLSAEQLTIHQRVENHGSQPLPFALGLHPYFSVNQKSELRLSLPASQYRNHQDQSWANFDGSLDWQAPELDLAFSPLTGQQATVEDRQQQSRLLMSFSEPYKTLVFWTIQGQDFYCLEPWTAPRNALNTGQDLIHLAAGNSFEATVAFSFSLV